MGNMTIRNLPDEVHEHLRIQAKTNGRSLEAEVCAILVHSYVAKYTDGFGQQIRARFEKAGMIGDDLTVTRDQTPGRAADFS